MEDRILPNTFDDLRPFWLKRQVQKRCRLITRQEVVTGLLLKTERATRSLDEHAATDYFIRLYQQDHYSTGIAH